ncbi:MAG: hypothetical protein JL50_11955 [Peptococcaceae bacterium BICA1-7]|nr:MAG: hypothetical protein JL50_11955 [Peptococcaceae bacterium BICA1-7]HBV98837.1 DUF2294 domain-containing protein [Desulfotomaculum sp.]
MTQSPADLKQSIMRIYNNVNQEMFEIGVKRLRVDIVGTKIVILAEHRRIPGLKALDMINRQVTRMTDVALLDENKQRLKESFEAGLGIKIRTVLKDYDPVQEVAATVVVLYEPINET